MSTNEIKTCTNEIHLILQGKGGVAKSLIASLIAQFFGSLGAQLYCADTDPVNNTFSQYAAFKAEYLKIMGRNNVIDSRSFDQLIEKLVTFNGVSIVDNGSSTFLPLSAYMLENNVVQLLQEHGKKVFIHTIVTGGQAMEETLDGLNLLLKTQKTAPIIVWENEFFGDVIKDDKTFTESNLYKGNKDRIRGLIRLHKSNPDTLGKDFELMLKQKLTFDEVAVSPNFTLMPRSRLLRVKASIFDQLTAVNW